MKKLFTIFLLFTVFYGTYAQEIAVISAPNTLETVLQSSQSYKFTLRNNKASSQTIFIEVNQEALLGGSNAIICYDNRCSSEKLTLTVGPNASSREIELILRGGLSNLNTVLELKFNDIKNRQLLSLNLPVIVKESFQQDVFYEKNNISVKNFYPNPAQEYATLQYNIGNLRGKAKIVLQNVLGSKINEFILEPGNYKLKLSTENLKPGVYFYTLLLNDEGLATRKLIVKK